MAGKNKGTVKGSGQLHGYIAAIGVMPVEKIRNALLLFYEPDRFINEFFKVRPEQLLADISTASALDADNPHLVTKGFYLPAIIRGDGLILDSAGKEINSVDIISPGKRPGKFQNILYLAARIGIPSQFLRLSSDKPMQTEKL
jgi:hypothetical protein